MQRGLPLTVVGTFLCLSAGTVFARDTMKIDTDKPADYQAVESDLNDIADYLQEVQCGGFDSNQTVVGKIATVSGVPGRDSNPFDAPLSGMGVRQDDFLYPDTANGLSTVCAPGRSQIPKSVWREGGSLPNQIVKVSITFPHPKFEDPACRWRAKDADGNFLNSAPSVPLKDDETIPDFDQTSDGPDKRDPPNDRQSPPLCNEFCSYLNTWQYRDCLEPGTATDDATGTEYSVCGRWGVRYLCSDQEVTDLANACNPGATDKGNSRVCQGDECRCMQQKQDTDPSVTPPTPLLGCVANPGTGRPDESSVYYSYARGYNGSFVRDAIASDGPADDIARSRVRVACYGFYDEFDPKFHQTETKDRRCVINMDVSTMRDSQIGKGPYGEDTDALKDVDPVSVDEQRVKKDTAKDLWYLKLGWGFSLLKEDVFKTDYNYDLSSVFGDGDNLDRAQMTGTWQVSKDGEDPHLAVSNNLRAFDDTGDKRTIVSWWQKQQTDMATLLHPPIVRIVLPPAYSFGADAKDPLFATQSSSSSSVSSVAPADAKRSKRMEVQIDAGEDILGDVLGVIERSFLVHVEEDPVPVMLVAASPTELRARAEQWCTWYMTKAGKKNCDEAPAKVRDVIDKLLQYADDIEKERELRALLATYAGKVVDIQTALTRPISEWMRTNLNTYNTYIRTQMELGQLVGDQWKQVREIVSRFHDISNLPWCMNQRFTTPIYSLLDRWMPARADDGKLTADGLPNITAPRGKDVVIDFSNLRYMTGSLMLPVLKPVQIRLNFPRIPATLTDEDLDTIEPLPDLPSIDAIKTAFEDAANKLPQVEASRTIPPLDLPPVDDATLSNMLVTVQNMKQVVTDMDKRYDLFWKSIGPLSTEDIDMDRDGILARKTRLECKFDEEEDPVCQHVEMDLRERFQRIGSRKMVFLREDYQPLSVPRITPAFCQPMDQVCLLLHGEAPKPAYQWDIIAPKIMPDLGTETRSAVRDATLPDPVGTVDRNDLPPYNVNIDDLLPFYDIEKPLDLTPTP